MRKLHPVFVIVIVFGAVDASAQTEAQSQPTTEIHSVTPFELVSTAIPALQMMELDALIPIATPDLVERLGSVGDAASLNETFPIRHYPWGEVVAVAADLQEGRWAPSEATERRLWVKIRDLNRLDVSVVTVVEMDGEWRIGDVEVVEMDVWRAALEVEGAL